MCCTHVYVVCVACMYVGCTPDPVYRGGGPGLGWCYPLLSPPHLETGPSLTTELIITLASKPGRRRSYRTWPALGFEAWVTSPSFCTVVGDPDLGLRPHTCTGSTSPASISPARCFLLTGQTSPNQSLYNLLFYSKALERAASVSVRCSSCLLTPLPELLDQ